MVTSMLAINQTIFIIILNVNGFNMQIIELVRLWIKRQDLVNTVHKKPTSKDWGGMQREGNINHSQTSQKKAAGTILTSAKMPSGTQRNIM